MGLGSFLLLVVLNSVNVVGRERRYLEGWVFTSSGGFVCCMVVSSMSSHTAPTHPQGGGRGVWTIPEGSPSDPGNLRKIKVFDACTALAAGQLRKREPQLVLYGVYVVGRERRYLEAWVFSSSGGLV